MIESKDSKYGTEIMASLEDQLVPMDEHEASLYRKFIRPDAKMWLRIAFDGIHRQFEFENEIANERERKAKEYGFCQN